MKKINNDVRKYAQDSGVYLYEIGNRLGMNDGNFSRLLRFKLSQQKKDEILKIINDLMEERKNVAK